MGNQVNHKISIAMATYNGGQFLREQLESIILQSHPPFELIVCDDASSDNTVDILKSFENEVSLKIIRNKQRQGPIKSFETAILGCSCEYIAISDQDDIWLPKKLERSLQKIFLMSTSNEIPLLVFSDLKVVTENLDCISESFWKYAALNPRKTSLARLLTVNCVTGCTVLINRKLVEVGLPFGKNTLMHDYWLALVATAFGKIDYLNFPTVLYRQYGGNCLGARPMQLSRGVSRKINFVYRYVIKHEFDGYLNKNILQASDFLEQFSSQLKGTNQEVLQQFKTLTTEGGLGTVFKMLKYGFLRSNLPESIELLFKYGCRKK